MKEPFIQHASFFFFFFPFAGSEFDALVRGKVAERLRRLGNERRRPLTVGGAGGAN